LTVSVLQELSNFFVERRSQPIPQDVEKAAIKAIIDWTAGTLVGAREKPSQILATSLQDSMNANARARTFTGHGLTDVRTAALINGTAAHVSEIDDIYRDGLYHPGAPTIAAAIAIGEAQGASGADLIRAVVVGYEIGCRIAREVNPTHYKYWHTTGTVGAIGAAAAAAEILKLNSTQFTDALATSITMAAGLQQAFKDDSMSKPLHSGRAAESGVLSAMAAKQGFTGSHGIFDGSSGFSVAMGNGPTTSEVLDNLGNSWAIKEITVKNHFCCGHTFAPIDGALELSSKGIKADQIKSIEVETYSKAIEIAGIKSPTTAFDAKFSIPYTVATALCGGTVRIKAFEDEALQNSEVRKLMHLVTLKPSAEKDLNYPRKRSAKITITTLDGSVHVSDRQTRKGDPDDPMSQAEVSSKFVDLINPIYGELVTNEILAQLSSLSKIDDIRTIKFNG
jgi:2-methylcitrate dehydratase PrpD